MYNEYSPYGENRRVKKRGAATALLLTLCIVFSALFGFTGSLLYNRLILSDTAPAEIAAPSTQITAEEPSPYTSVPPAETPQVQTMLTTDGTKTAMTVQGVAAAVKDSIVEISTETVTTNNRFGQFVTEGAGSGVIISEDGYIVTNNHVVVGARGITVRLSGGREYPAVIVGTDVKTDLALLRISATGLKPAVLGDSSKLVVGESAIAAGNPLGELGGTITCGIISALDRAIIIDGEIMTLLQTDAAINPGNSGGGLFNLYGELVGIVNAKSSGTDIEGLGFAIPVNTVEKVVGDIAEYGYVRGRVDTGLTLIEINDSFSAIMYRVSQSGLYISGSVHQGLQSGDRITAVNGMAVTNIIGWNVILDTMKAGDTMTVTVSRGNQSLSVDIVLTELRK